MKTERYIPQGMTYIEREELKSFATSFGLRDDIQSLTRTLIMIAHWMRQGQNVSFTGSALRWLWLDYTSGALPVAVLFSSLTVAPVRKIRPPEKEQTALRWKRNRKEQLEVKQNRWTPLVTTLDG